MNENGGRLLIAVIPRSCGEEYTAFFAENEARTVLAALCEGTAKKKTLDLLGLEDRELALVSCLVPTAQARTLMKKLVRELRIDAPGAGIALTVPIEQSEESEDNTMREPEYSLIVAIAEGGSSETVMDAATGAGARGGTIVHAKGTGAKMAPKFFGVTIAEEKDMLYIVVARQIRDAVVGAIRDKTKAFVFTMPVEQVAGISGLPE